MTDAGELRKGQAHIKHQGQHKYISGKESKWDHQPQKAKSPNSSPSPDSSQPLKGSDITRKF